MDINKKIKEMTYKRGWTMYNLALESGLTQSTLTSMLNRGNAPKIDTLQCICDAFGITLAQFFLEDESLEFISDAEKELLSLYRKLPEEKKRALIKLLD